jgi:hypothetical protein
MASGLVKLKVRPLRFAFLVEPNDPAAVLNAIQTSTFLWGGMLNPIIPYYKRLPRSWNNEPKSVRPRAREVLEGYLSAFDPDFIVKVGGLESASLDFGNYTVVTLTEVIGQLEKDGLPSYGIGLFEVLRHIENTELKFVRRESLQFSIPTFGPKHKLFLSSVFGCLAPALESLFHNIFGTLPGLNRPDCSVQNYWEFLEPQNLFFRRIGMMDIRMVRNPNFNSDCLFFLEAGEITDLIDFWNLRCTGWNVVPICRESAGSPGLQKFASDFVEANFRPLRYSPNVFTETLLLKSRSASVDDCEQFGRSLPLKPGSQPHERKIVLQLWFPRIWNEWAREKDGVARCEATASEKEYPIRKTDENVSFKSVVPSFANRFGAQRGPRCANEIELHLWGGDEPFAEVIPVGGRAVTAAAGVLSSLDWRCSEAGLVHLASYENFPIHLFPPLGQRVFTAWLRERKWNPELSDKGHVAQQMLRYLGNRGGVRLLALPGMFEFINLISGRGVIHVAHVRAELSRIAEGQKLGNLDADILLRGLLSHRVLQLGIELQCPYCRQRSWFSLSEADYEVQCRTCLESFELPSESPKKVAWAYRAVGPFSLPNSAYGCLSVLLTMRFFMDQLDGITTPLLSFIAKKNNIEIEVDLGLFFRRSKYQVCHTELILAECKTLNDFTLKDAERMIELSAQFPGAVLVFATLKKQLTEKEKKLLRPVVNRGRKYWKDGRPYNPVLILTGNELFSDSHPRRAWADIGGAHAAHASNLSLRTELTGLADATQQIYLGLPAWPTWLRDRAGRRRKPSTNPPPLDLEEGLAIGDESESAAVPLWVRMQHLPFRPDSTP